MRHLFGMIAGLNIFFSITVAATDRQEAADYYELCVQDALASARTGADVKRKLPECNSNGVAMFESLAIMNRQVKGWCQNQPEPCADKEVCAPALGPRICKEETVVCADGLVKAPSGDKCYCPNTTTAVNSVDQCSRPNTCPTGLQSKSGKCVCPGGTTEATSVAQCKKTQPDTEPIVTQEQANRDLDQVAQLQKRADLCCHDPTACGAPTQSDTSAYQPAPGQGLGDYCNQMQKLGLANADANSQAAGVCTSSYTACSSAAKDQVRNYQTLADECADCDSASIIASTLARLQAMTSTCDGFASLVQAMSKQAIASSTASGKSSICKNVAGYNPQSAQPSAIDLSVCAQNPNAFGCPTQTQAANPDHGNGKDGFQNGKQDKPGFNPSEISDTSGFSSYGTADQKNPQTGHTIPGDSSGFGDAGASSGQAKLDPRGTNAAGASGVSTDIIQGHLAGGYSSSSAYALNSARAGAANRGGVQPAGQKMDLKPYLLPPNSRRFPAGLQQKDGILGKWDDIWQHIRDRMQEKCKLGVLQDCQLGK